MAWPLGDNSDPQRQALFEELDGARRDAQAIWAEFEVARKPVVESAQTGKAIDKAMLSKIEAVHERYKAASALKQTCEDKYHRCLENVEGIRPPTGFGGPMTRP